MTAELVRVDLDRETRARRERQHSDRGASMVGGVHFLNGTAYVPRGSTLERRLQSGQWRGATVVEDVDDVDDVADHEQRPEAILHPPQPAPTECWPGVCPFGGRATGHACGSLYPHNFTPLPEPEPGLAL